MTTTVINEDSRSGANTSDTSRARRNATKRITVMAISAAIAAERKEPIIVALVAWIVTAGPPASGAIAKIAATNSRSRIVLPANGFGTTWTRARPSDRTQSRARSDGMV